MSKIELNYKKLGAGEPLLILHGLFGSLDNWMTLAKKWSESYEVWLIDQRNHGKSPHTKEHSYQAMADDLKNFMDQHGIDKANILGHSMGGKTAMEFAMNYPERLIKLVVVDIAPVSYNVHHWLIIDALESVDLDKTTSRKEADEKLQEKIQEFGVRQFLLKNLDRLSDGKYAWKFNLQLLKDSIVPISEWAISEGEYQGETLFIKGGNSEYILPQYALEISQKFPNYELEEIADAGHWVHAESPQAFNQALMKFMR